MCNGGKRVLAAGTSIAASHKRMSSACSRRSSCRALGWWCPGTSLTLAARLAALACPDVATRSSSQACALPRALAAARALPPQFAQTCSYGMPRCAATARRTATGCLSWQRGSMSAGRCQQQGETISGNGRASLNPMPAPATCCAARSGWSARSPALAAWQGPCNARL